MWEWLINGNKLYGKDYTYMIDNGSLVSVFNINNFYQLSGDNFTNYSGWKKVIKKEWYEEIPSHGRLCLVDAEIVMVKEHFNDEKQFIDLNNDNVDWKYIIPLTNEEIKKYLVDE